MTNTSYTKKGVPTEDCTEYFTSPILEENHYYPFGLKHEGYNMNNAQADYKYKYNGKELQTELGLGQYDLGARMYDPAIGRFMVMDPMADFVNYQSPFVASDNNPVLYRDEYGLGILNVIGNLFRRAVTGVKQIVLGKNCNCGGKEDSIAKSWNDPDFGWYKPYKSTTRKGQNNSVVRTPFNGERQYGFTLNPFEPFRMPAANLNNLNIFEEDKDFDFILKGNISFYGNSDKMNDENGKNEKFLKYILKTLKDYPQITLFISGNAIHRDPKEKVTLDTGTTLNGKLTTFKDLMLKRARAIEGYLIRNGIDGKRLTVAVGVFTRSNNSSLNFRNVPEKIKKYE